MPRRRADKPHLVLVVPPASAAGDDGLAQTAARWAHLLAGACAVRVEPHWRGAPADAMLACDAQRSAASIAAWRARHPERPLVVAPSGADLSQPEADAQRAIEQADRLLVRHECAPDDLPDALRAKCVVVLPPCRRRRARPKTVRHLRALMVGPLCDATDPQTFFAAVRKLADRDDIVFDHVGPAIDRALGDAARALMRERPAYRWLGERSPRATLGHVERAHLLVQPGRTGVGIEVVAQALCCGTPVVASRTSSHVGLLGAEHRGLFAPGDASGLALLLARARADPAMLAALRAQGERRSALFDPARGRATLRHLFAELLEHRRR